MSKFLYDFNDSQVYRTAQQALLYCKSGFATAPVSIPESLQEELGRGTIPANEFLQRLDLFEFLD